MIKCFVQIASHILAVIMILVANENEKLRFFKSNALLIVLPHCYIIYNLLMGNISGHIDLDVA